MRFVHSGLATPAASLEDDCRIAARLAADLLEVAADKLGPALERGGLAGLLRRHGVRACSVAAVEDVTFRDLAGLEAVTAAVHRLSEVARSVGATWLVVTPGERPDGADERDALREARETLGRLARIGERYDVGIALCPLGRREASVRTLRQAMAVVDAVGRRSVALALDTFELWAARSTPGDLKACHPRWLAMLRLADAERGVEPEQARAHHRRCPGDGAIDLSAWLAVAGALVPDLPVTCPVAPPPGTPADEAEGWARRLRERTLDASRPEGAVGR